jgi:hypothetical protein
MPRGSKPPQTILPWPTRRKADIELDVGAKRFAAGLLPELINALRRSRPGDLLSVVDEEASVAAELARRRSRKRASAERLAAILFGFFYCCLVSHHALRRLWRDAAGKFATAQAS